MNNLASSISTASFQSAQYIYKPLRESGKIRTLTIHPTRSRIEISLRVKKQKYGDYHALSYGWGSEEQPYEAVVVGLKGKELGRIPLTQNLRDALCDLRDSADFGQKSFWIDQICINQEDSDEKNTQVAMMGSIYRDANGVIVYLGRAANEVQEQRGIRLLHQLWSYYESEIASLRSDITEYTLHMRAICGELKSLSQWLEDPDIATDQWDVSVEDWIWLYELCSGHWTQRLWMVQEQVINSNTTMLRGHHVISWDILAGVALMASVVDIFPEDLGATFEKKKCSDWATAGLLDALFFLVRNRYRGSGKRTGAPVNSIRQAMKSLRALQCHDPRDRVYALMAICRESKGLGLVADYSSSNTVHSLSLSLTQRLLVRTINTLIDVSLSRPPDGTYSSPSWALPLIIEESFSPPTTFDEVFHPHPVRSRRAKPHFDMDHTPPVMTIKGRILDAPSMILKRAVSDGDGSGSMTNCMAQLCKIILESDVSEDVVTNLSHALLWLDYEADPEGYDAAYHLWCLFKDYINTPGLEDAVIKDCNELLPILADMCVVFRAVRTGPEVEQEEKGMLPRIINALRGRSFFYSESQHFCNTMHEIQPSDTIAAFQGANCLYILRPVGERYLLVGDAYVAGWMIGEAYEGLDYEEVDYDIEII